MKRVVITGMSILTPLGDTLDTFLQNLLQGRSALGCWNAPHSARIRAVVAGSLLGYDIMARLSWLRQHIPDGLARRLPSLLRHAAWSAKLSLLLAVDAFRDARLFAVPTDGERISTLITGHNFNLQYLHRNWDRFVEDPEEIDFSLAVSEWDCDHVGCVADALGIFGPSYTVGGACASGNIGLRSAMDEIRQHDAEVVLVVGPVLDFSSLTLHALAALGAIPLSSFNHEPHRASRPFDAAREGFVLSHGGGALVVEHLEHARARGARIHAEILGVEANSAASRIPDPSEEHEARVIERLLQKLDVGKEEIDFVSAHATSTVLGDVAEIRALKLVFGEHAARLKINAPKSMLGHTAWSSAVVETVAAVLQMGAGWLHPSINVAQLDPEIDLDVCANRAVKHAVRCLLKNAFGFGGINSASIIRRFEN